MLPGSRSPVAEPGLDVDHRARLVVLSEQQVVAAPVDHLLGQVTLAGGGIAGDDLALQRQDAEQFEGGLVFVGPGIDSDLAQDGLGLGGVGGDVFMAYMTGWRISDLEAGTAITRPRTTRRSGTTWSSCTPWCSTTRRSKRLRATKRRPGTRRTASLREVGGMGIARFGTIRRNPLPCLVPRVGLEPTTR